MKQVSYRGYINIRGHYTKLSCMRFVYPRFEGLCLAFSYIIRAIFPYLYDHLLIICRLYYCFHSERMFSIYLFLTIYTIITMNFCFINRVICGEGNWLTTNEPKSINSQDDNSWRIFHFFCIYHLCIHLASLYFYAHNLWCTNFCSVL
jgi:hypothetical protein